MDSEHSLHWGNNPKKLFPLFFAKPPVKLANGPTPPPPPPPHPASFLDRSPYILVFRVPPPLSLPPYKSDFSVNPHNIKIFHP